MLMDLRDCQITGKEAQIFLEKAGIIVNKNTIPNDPQKPFIGSGIRLGTPVVTTRGMKEKEMVTIANLISDTIKNKNPQQIKKQVLKLTKKFPRP